MTKRISILFALALALGCGEDSAAEGGPGQVQASGECILRPGDYMIEYSVVSDTCDVGALPSELMSVASDGSASQSTETPDGCADTAPSEVGCSVSWRRECDVPSQGYVAHLDVAYAVDLARGSGTINIKGRATDATTGSVVSTCTSAQRATFSKLN